MLFVCALDGTRTSKRTPELRQDVILRKPITIEDFINTVKNNRLGL
jgi:hypothetical protein